MGSRDEEVRSWKLQTFNRPAVAVVLSRLIGTAEHDIIEPIPVDTTIAHDCAGRAVVRSSIRAGGGSDPCENRDPFPVTGYRKIDIRYLYTADHGRKRRCV
jgi:hypothetical protein